MPLHRRASQLLLSLLLSVSTSLPPTNLPPPPTPLTPTALQTYLTKTYPHWHKTHRHSRKIRRLIYRFETPQPGLGHRLRVLLTAYIYAVFTSRLLLLDWSIPYEIFHYLPPSPSLQLRYNPIQDTLPKNITRFPTTHPASASLSLLLSPTSTILATSLPTVFPSILHRLSHTHPTLPLSKAILSNLTENNPLPVSLFHAILTLFFNFNSAIPHLHSMLPTAPPLPTPHFIALHARLGEGVGESRGRFAPLAHRRKLAKCLAEVAIQAAKVYGTSAFFLATDTPSFRPLLKQALGKRVANVRFVGEERLLPLHTSHCDSEEERDRCVYAFLEMLGLARGDAIVALPSGFSLIAGFVGNVDDYRVVDVMSCIRG